MLGKVADGEDPAGAPYSDAARSIPRPYEGEAASFEEDGHRLRTVLAQLDKAVSNRRYVDSWRDLMAGQMDRRDALEAKAAERGVAVTDHKRYDTWQDVIDEAVGRCVGVLADRGNFGFHLDCIARRGESLGLALSRVREVLVKDDRRLAATLAGQRKGEDVRMREQRVARLLDDPEKLRELRQQRAERRPGSSCIRLGIGV